MSENGSYVRQIFQPRESAAEEIEQLRNHVASLEQEIIERQQIEQKLLTHVEVLTEEIVERQKSELALQKFLADTASATGRDLYPILAHHIALALGVSYVVVAEATAWKEQTPTRANVLAVWNSDQLGESLEYDLVDTPCESIFTEETLVNNNGISCYPNSVQEFFPKGKALAALGGECFLGVALKDSNTDKLMGHICFIDNKPLIQAERAKAIMSIFASRVAAELERERAESEIRKALAQEQEFSALKSNFITTASHEFRTPLTTILGSAESLIYYQNRWSEDKKNIYLQRIADSVKHMTQLLDDVLIVATANAGKLNLKPTLIDLKEFCQELTSELQIADGNKHAIAFSTSFECSPLPANKAVAYLDENLLRRIFTNLLSNALKYSPVGSAVSFELIYQTERAIFLIQDQGIGIPQADQQRLFESFYRANNVGTIQGTGLGLAIAKTAVDLQGGTISFNSEMEVGTTFKVILPLNNYQNSSDGY